MKIFFLVSRVPYPLEKGDKLRAFHQIRLLSEKHEIHLCALNDKKLHPEAIAVLNKYCKSVHVLTLPLISRAINLMKAFISGKPLQAGYFYNSSNSRAIDMLISSISPDVLFCQLIRVAEYVKNREEKKIIDYQDAFSAGMKRRAENSGIISKMIFLMESGRLEKYEAKVFSWFDNQIIISAQDRDLIVHPQKANIKVVPNGVDGDFFKPIEKEKKYTLIFSGNMSYAPNVLSATFLVKHILPLVQKQIPSVTLILAGANPSPKVKELKAQNVFVSGWVDDIRELYAEAEIFIAPMQIGTGLQNKLLEAMSMQIPCVTSPLANNALGAENNKEILVAETPEQYANHILKLITDKKFAESLGKNGNLFVKGKYHWNKVITELEDVLQA